MGLSIDFYISMSYCLWLCLHFFLFCFVFLFLCLYLGCVGLVWFCLFGFVFIRKAGTWEWQCC